MNNLIKTLTELHGMLKTVEPNIRKDTPNVLMVQVGKKFEKFGKNKGKGKISRIENPTKSDPSSKFKHGPFGNDKRHYCNGPVHWKRNCDKFLEDLKKKKTFKTYSPGSPVVPSKAQGSPKDYVNAHNQARSEVGVGPMQWDEGLAAYAGNYVDQLKSDCRLVHSGGPYGENLAMSTGDLSAVTAVKLWVNEKANYNYATNSCNEVCGHYTQVVWRKSVRLGCAKVRCNNGGTIILCNYDPPGNYVKERPY